MIVNFEGLVSLLDKNNLEIRKQLIDEAKKSILDSDLVIFSDFNYGVLDNDTVRTLIAFAKENGKYRT